MPNTKQTGMNFAAAFLFAVILVFRAIALVNVYKNIRYASAIPGKTALLFWVCLIVDTLIVLAILGAIVFLCMGDMTRYGWMAIVVGAGMAVEYGLFVILLLSSAGRYSFQVVFDWRVILIFSGIGLQCATYIHSGLTSKRYEEGNQLGNKWLTAPVMYILSLVLMLIPVLAVKADLSEYLSISGSGRQSSGQTITLLAIYFLAFLTVGLHLNIRAKKEGIYGNGQRPAVRGVPAYNANPYAPFNNPVQGGVPYPQQGRTPYGAAPYQGGAQYGAAAAYRGGAQYGGAAPYQGGAQYNGGSSYQGGAQYNGGSSYQGGAQYNGGSSYQGGAQYNGGSSYQGGAQYGGAAPFSPEPSKGGSISAGYGDAGYSDSTRSDHGRSDYGSAYDDPYQGYFKPTDDK